MLPVQRQALINILEGYVNNMDEIISIRPNHKATVSLDRDQIATIILFIQDPTLQTTEEFPQAVEQEGVHPVIRDEGEIVGVKEFEPRDEVLLNGDSHD